MEIERFESISRRTAKVIVRSRVLHPHPRPLEYQKWFSMRNDSRCLSSPASLKRSRLVLNSSSTGGCCPVPSARSSFSEIVPGLVYQKWAQQQILLLLLLLRLWELQKFGPGDVGEPERRDGLWTTELHFHEPWKFDQNWSCWEIYEVVTWNFIERVIDASFASGSWLLPNDPVSKTSNDKALQERNFEYTFGPKLIISSSARRTRLKARPKPQHSETRLALNI